MTTPFALTATVTDNFTGEKGLGTGVFNVTNPSQPPPPSNQCLYGWYDPANDGNLSGGWSGGDGGMQLAEPNVKIATYYIQWNGSFPNTLAAQAQAHGCTPFIELEPWFSTTSWPSFTGITAGASDTYLQSLGTAIATFGHDVWVTYAHEMNGSWYPWGNGGPQGITPAQWIAGWTHVRSVVNSTAGGHAKWVWAPNNADVGSVVPYWPGDALVDIAAYDGYIQNSSQTFANFQQNTVNQIKSVTSKQIWNSECGLNPVDGNQPTAIRNFIAAMRHAGLSGFMWWNQSPFNVTGAALNAVNQAVADWNAGTL